MSPPDATDRLERYRSMRDFEVTPEPSGAPGPTAPPTGSARFVVQRHRARRLHYDVRLEMGGVLVSWAVPKGPTLDPDAKRLAVHVEDHPLEYFDFEGVIPAGEYGGGDVIVWDWGTWEPAPRMGDPLEAVAGGEVHVDLFGERLRGRFAIVRRGRRDGKEQWLMFHKHDDAAVAGWDAEDHPTSVKSGRTNDEVAADPDTTWDSNAPAAEAAIPVARRAPVGGPPREVPTWAPPTDDELAALDELGPKGGEWHVDGEVVKLTNLEKVLFPATGDEPATTKRDLIRYHACIAPHMLPYLEGRAVNQNRFPDGVDRKHFWSKSVPSNAPAWLHRWRNAEADPGETEWYVVADRPAALVFLANQASLELHPWTSRTEAPQQPTWAYIDIDPGPSSTFEDALVLARLYRTALDHLGVVGCPKVTGKRGIQIWVPVADGYRFDDTRGWVEKVSRAVGATVPDMVSWKWHKADRQGLTRLDYTQNAINRTLVAPFSARPAPGAPVSVPITWDELDDPDLRPDRWTVRSVLARLDEVGDPLRPLVGQQQVLPDLG
ncbi:MAG TPA: DNA polymerase ligase N-terminal domain-containing protein [Aquihabitans sp.]|nr:DNA polymerase ligase N-terminal domain-containing protein [Aquihabitans sp.]